MPEPDERTLDFIYQEARAKVDQQIRQIDALDTKAYALLAAASVIAFAPALRLELSKLPWYSLGLLAFAGLCYLDLLWSLRSAIRPREYNFPPDPGVLAKHYLGDAPAEVKRVALDTIIDAVKYNKDQINDKADLAGRALGLLVIESLSLTLGLLLG